MRRRKSALIKSNNRHLAGGQKYIVELNVPCSSFEAQ